MKTPRSVKLFVLVLGAMMTGVDPHRAGLGGNHEVAAPNQKGQPGYEGYLNNNVVSLAEVLKDAGYHTYLSGKWHLGKTGGEPLYQGFGTSIMAGASGAPPSYFWPYENRLGEDGGSSGTGEVYLAVKADSF